MYYRLDNLGRATWTFVVFFLWVVVTFYGMRLAIMHGFDIGSAIHGWSRSNGINPSSSDLFRFFISGMAFFVLPVLTGHAFLLLNRFLKGTPRVEQISISRNERQHLPSTSRSLRAMSERSVRSVRRRRPDAP